VKPAAVLAASVAALSFAAAAGSVPRTQEVAVQFSDYGPSQLDVLPGQTVTWSNVSQRTHTVTSDTGVFDSGHLGPGARFQVAFDRPGTYRYHCTIHASIVGEIDVRRVTLGPLPTAAVPLGDRVEFTGLTADPAKPIRIERKESGSRFATVATASAGRDGAWRTDVPVRATGDYRARVGAAVSETRRLIVGIRTVHVTRVAKGVSVEVTPSDPYATILVEVYRRERFGWWPVARRRLDYVSAAEVRVPRPARVRVVLVDRDGWTPIATSRALTLASRPRPGG
jgi:plastocyanin